MHFHLRTGRFTQSLCFENRSLLFKIRTWLDKAKISLRKQSCLTPNEGLTCNNSAVSLPERSTVIYEVLLSDNGSSKSIFHIQLYAKKSEFRKSQDYALEYISNSVSGLQLDYNVKSKDAF